ncbi:MAG: U32 family peptidase [Paramuribaculum sp.]|nr:U32 family peptidase [Paramuribaculum sp.]
MVRSIELLAPARNADVAIEAIKHGADAVYMGAGSHGARAAAGNSLDDIERVVKYAHIFGARVYVTVNTIVYDDELLQVEQLVRSLYNIGVDALIVQDMALLQMDLPPIALHASTQCDIRTPQKAQLMQAAGFSQVVLARELSLEETAAIHASVDVPLEAFVHGALCVSYSGDCQAGWALQRRSANRGECPQICRLRYDLLDADGRMLVKGKHLLSLRDLNRSKYIEEMLESGVSSLKIEGRLKDADYVKNITAHYRRLLDEIIGAHPDKYVRASYGSSKISFTPDVAQSFNRGFTTYFTKPLALSSRMASINTPKWSGVPVGTVKSVSPKFITAALSTQLANGDGLGFFARSGEFVGFRLNRVDGNRLFPASAVSPEPGSTLYRNRNKVRADLMMGNTAERALKVDFILRAVGWGVALKATDESGASVELTAALELAPASKPQAEVRANTLRKLGGTHYCPGDICDEAGDWFVPVSVLASLRRDVLERLDAARIATHKFDYRRGADDKALTVLLDGKLLDRHDNVSNKLAEKFYTSYGAKVKERAMEVMPLAKKRVQVMETRYCLRREMGRCLRTVEGREWRGPLVLASAYGNLEVEFDCARCRMFVYSS